MKRSCKFLILIIVMFMLSFIVTNNVNADVQIYRESDYDRVENTVNNFIFYLDIGSSNIYSIIDSTNTELYQGILEYLYEDIEIEYDVKKIEKISDNTYEVKGEIEAYGEDWNANGFSVSFEVEESYGTYKIISTNLFNKIGEENVDKTMFMAIIVLLMIVFAALFSIGITIMAVVIIVIVNKKKKNEDNKQ
ncbi:MAG: hypothetical protein IJN50_02520 [Clostridia bacterium]|nr:hypothetical protein [Clostridia bacterium]